MHLRSRPRGHQGGMRLKALLCVHHQRDLSIHRTTQTSGRSRSLSRARKSPASIFLSRDRLYLISRFTQKNSPRLFSRQGPVSFSWQHSWIIWYPRSKSFRRLYISSRADISLVGAFFRDIVFYVWRIYFSENLEYRYFSNRGGLSEYRVARFEESIFAKISSTDISLIEAFFCYLKICV